ncbi:Squalene epoxidase [Blyttiomyces sp. JEL0837]|nr:Squalene epoxidase [Blyttiomyces sp. JEL0837]
MTVQAQEKSTPEVIIIGAGIVGTALATSLGRDGRRVLVIERDMKEPDRIVGELLQPGGVKALETLGLDDCLQNIDAIPCNGYVVFNDPENVHLPYPDDAKSKKPNVGYSFHHGRFIMNLRRAMLDCENVEVIEGTVASLISDPVSDRVLGVSYTLKTETGESVSKEAYAPLTVVADGCFSKFRKQLITKNVEVSSHFVGFVLTDCDLPRPNHGHVILAQPSPILLYQIGTHDTRILVDVPGKLPSQGNGDLKKYMEEKVGPQLPKSVQSSFYKALETERLRVMPNSYLPPSSTKREGVIVLGDAMNMRHPLTGGGMTVAFWDVVHVRKLLSLDGRVKEAFVEGNSKVVLRELRRLHWRRKGLSSVVNILANALYDLFSAGDNANMKVLQQACFGYFKLGGICVSTPVSLLAGIIQSPMTLILHFFAVAIYGTWLLLLSEPFWMIPKNLVRSVIVIYTACVVVFPLMAGEVAW